MPEPSPALRRRTVVVGGAAALGAGLVVSGCATAAPSGGGAAAGSGRTVSGAPAGTTLGPASDVPVGSAKIYSAQEVVVTQATAGSYAAFSTACPHQGCAVAKVEDEDIVCPCHGSTFGLDGSVLSGPAATGLTGRKVTVTGGRITLA